MCWWKKCTNTIIANGIKVCPFYLLLDLSSLNAPKMRALSSFRAWRSSSLVLYKIKQHSLHFSLPLGINCTKEQQTDQHKLTSFQSSLALFGQFVRGATRRASARGGLLSRSPSKCWQTRRREDTGRAPPVCSPKGLLSLLPDFLEKLIAPHSICFASRPEGVFNWIILDGTDVISYARKSILPLACKVTTRIASDMMQFIASHKPTTDRSTCWQADNNGAFRTTWATRRGCATCSTRSTRWNSIF